MYNMYMASESFTTTRTDRDFQETVDKKFVEFIETGNLLIDLEDLNPLERTILFSKLAAKFAEYAGDLINF